MERLEFSQDSLPEDVVRKIVSRLEVLDVCSLRCCSKNWREICESDDLWKSLCEERWPGVVLEEEEAETNDDYYQEKASNLKGWKGLCMKKHNELVGYADYLKERLSCQAINVGDYLKAIEDMKSMQFGFIDVRILFLQPKNHVLLNLLGLHYCIRQLGVQVGSVVEALSSCNIQDREVDIHWWKKVVWSHRCRLPDELHSLSFFLKDLTTDEGEEILMMLEQGITRDLVRVQISAAKNEEAVVIWRRTQQSY